MAEGRSAPMLLFTFCCHHQACLAKKPAILSATGVASGAGISWQGLLDVISFPAPVPPPGLVRLAHAAQSSLFRERLHAGIKLLAKRTERCTVASLRQTVADGVEENRRKLSICASDLSEAEQEEILSMLNHNWNEQIGDGRLRHWCVPGCCVSLAQTRAKMESALLASLGRVYEAPLLYRWKHWEGAIHYALRNTAMHNILVRVWHGCVNSKMDEALLEQVIDADSPDMDPGLKQQVRVTRVFRLLSEPNILAKFAQCVIITAPLAGYMHYASLVETVRHRVYLRARGLNPPSTCPYGEDELRAMNFNLLTGQRGWEVVHDYYSLLMSPPGSPAWFPEFELPHTECVLLIFATMCDSWRRLVMPYQSLTSTCLQVASLSAQEGLEFLFRENRKMQACNLCQDQHFVRVPCWKGKKWGHVWL